MPVDLIRNGGKPILLADCARVVNLRYTVLIVAENSFECVSLPMPVEMQLARIIISEISDSQVIYLKEVDGERQFPILIGIFEATTIDRRVKDTTQPTRPLTHDLIVKVAEALGAEVDSVVIHELTAHTYYASLRLRKNGELIEIDSRPSDAIAVAVTFSPPLPIFVSEQVLAEATSSQ